MVTNDLRRFSVVLLIVITLVTCGIFIPIWFLMQRKGLNRLNTMVQLNHAPLIFALVVSGVELLGGGIAAEDASVELATSLLSLIASVVIIVQAFRVRDMLHRHFANERREGLRTLIRPHLSGLATFFLGPWYLQYRVNMLLDAHTPGETVVVEEE